MTEHVRPRTDEIPGRDEAVMEEVTMRSDEGEIWEEVEKEMKSDVVKVAESSKVAKKNEDAEGKSGAPGSEEKF